jgi:hypothetical protein
MCERREMNPGQLGEMLDLVRWRLDITIVESAVFDVQLYESMKDKKETARRRGVGSLSSIDEAASRG